VQRNKARWHAIGPAVFTFLMSTSVAVHRCVSLDFRLGHSLVLPIASCFIRLSSHTCMPVALDVMTMAARATVRRCAQHLSPASPAAPGGMAQRDDEQPQRKRRRRRSRRSPMTPPSVGQESDEECSASTHPSRHRPSPPSPAGVLPWVGAHRAGQPPISALTVKAMSPQMHTIHKAALTAESMLRPKAPPPGPVPMELRSRCKHPACSFLGHSILAVTETVPGYCCRPCAKCHFDDAVPRHGHRCQQEPARLCRPPGPAAGTARKSCRDGPTPARSPPPTPAYAALKASPRDVSRPSRAPGLLD
jgi:hypothetical protein